MHSEPTPRRQFLQGLAAVAAAGGWFSTHVSPAARAADSPQQDHPLRLGAPVFNAPADPEALALAHRQQGYRAAYCPAVRLNEPEKIRDISAAFAKHDVAIAEVGRWCNLLDADANKRAENLKTRHRRTGAGRRDRSPLLRRYRRLLQRGELVRPPSRKFSQRFFDATVENARRIIDAVKPKRAKFCFEMMGWALPDSPDSYVKLIQAVEREAFGVHLDPCNLINSPARFYDNTALLNECFDKLGPWIVSCHAKDVAWDVEMQVHFREVPLGKGSLDYTTYLKRLAALPHDPPLMIEHMQGPEEYEQSRRHLLELAEKIGIRFGAT